MWLGLAGALLVFTGIWHCVEWMMGGRNRDTYRLIPFGIAYLVFGYLIVTAKAGNPVLIVALVVTTVGAVAAFVLRKTWQVRPWVAWSFIVVDLIIIPCLLVTLLQN